MKTVIRRLDGRAPQPIDNRDKNLRTLIEDVKLRKDYPEILEISKRRQYLTVPLDRMAIYDQGSTPECVAYASAGMKSDQEWRQWGKLYEFDAHWLYRQCKARDGIPGAAGTYPRVACQVMMEGMVLKGGCLVKTQQQDPKWAIGGYYAVTEDIPDADLKIALVAYGTFLTACSWYPSWMNVGVIIPNPGGASDGGHCLTDSGWDDDMGGWVWRNTWGKQWGQYMKPGLAIMRYGMFREVVLQDQDSWKIIDGV